MHRRLTRQVSIGGVTVGGGAPVRIQSMTNTDTRDVAATVGQILALAEAGCQIVRVAVPDEAAAAAIRGIKKQISVPLVADIHFSHRLALAAIDAGADKIRINPGNIGGEENVREVVAAAKAAGIPVRIGVNSGSVEKELLAAHGGRSAAALAESALRWEEKIRAMGLEDLVISVKSSDVVENLEAHRILSARTDTPLHIGITEAGVGEAALVKSAVGIGALLLEGIGDTVRVSLTGDPVAEIAAAKQILASVGQLPGAVNLISCPTCGRCQANLAGLAEEVRAGIEKLESARIAAGRKDVLTVAVMGCAVNGPGEAAHADVGIACGKGQAVLFKKGAQVGTVREADAAAAVLSEAEKL
ncbi:MAG: flavodoxin-dependent (E)-4-hydroxy-3-methylbut-2-enyl-diphosphate synthase [Clostridiales Family XIII bacterium]|nr:flavodoxin-dependent (E)-4-hydroxy-3-methylbut-2-enyl-diphosphate synthase [Clostridiales Family XIII bacterium]